MTAPLALMPRQPVPPLSVPLAGGGTWTLDQQRNPNFTLVVFYRGLHCPICSRYLADLDAKLDGFAERGTGVVAISSDDAARAAESKAKWRIPNLALGHDLPLATARSWGLYISGGRNEREPALFVEPGLFLVRADGTLYFGSVQTMPFARPAFADLLGALDYAIKNDYPARGEVLDLPA
jgi:peroxiredoxin